MPVAKAEAVGRHDPAAQTAQTAQTRLPRWIPLAALIIIGLGLVDATYLTLTHYTTSVTLSCPDTGIVNCAKVTSSSYSKVLGLPLAVYGLIFFLGMLPLQLPVAWRSTNRWLRRLRLLGAGSGVLVVVWLVYVELFRLNAICLYCTGVHLLTVLLFVVTALGTAYSSE